MYCRTCAFRAARLCSRFAGPFQSFQNCDPHIFTTPTGKHPEHKLKDSLPQPQSQPQTGWRNRPKQSNCIPLPQHHQPWSRDISCLAPLLRTAKGSSNHGDMAIDILKPFWNLILRRFWPNLLTVALCTYERPRGQVNPTWPSTNRNQRNTVPWFLAKHWKPGGEGKRNSLQVIWPESRLLEYEMWNTLSEPKPTLWLILSKL